MRENGILFDRNQWRLCRKVSWVMKGGYQSQRRRWEGILGRVTAPIKAKEVGKRDLELQDGTGER